MREHQSPLGLLVLSETVPPVLLRRARAFSNRFPATIVFDPEHFTSFIDHAHDLPPSIQVNTVTLQELCKSRESPSGSIIIAALSFVHRLKGATTMDNKHSVFDALGAMSLLVVIGTLAMLLFR